MVKRSGTILVAIAAVIASCLAVVLPPSGSSEAAVPVTGRFTYVTNSVSGFVVGYSIDPTTGALTQLPSSP